MNQTQNSPAERDEYRVPPAGTLSRGFLGGVLMGLANLVPGVSGGTMLVATGVYGRFIDAVARCTTFRFNAGPVVMLGIIVVGALAAILLGAGTMSSLVMEHRWVMYSLFIGLTLGGVPLLWKMAQPMNTNTTLGMISGLVAMIALALLEGMTDGPAFQQSSTWLLVLTGAAAGAAMVLPGVSGSYLLLILGQYVIILDAVDALRRGEAGDAMGVILPVGIGVVIGVVVISNVVSSLLRRARNATLGVLIGLLLGAIFGLWPYRAPVEPRVGDMIRGQLIETQAQIDAIDPGHWASAFYVPSAGMVAGSFALLLVGFAASLAISRLGREETA